MSLRLKLILVSVLLVVITVTVSGYLGYRESKWKLKELARELLVSKTEQAYALCEQHFKNELAPSDELKRDIARLKIAKDGYVTIIVNEEGLNKGVLIVHPTDVGKSLYNDDFPHIKKVLDEVDAAGGQNGYANFTFYRQHTHAKGRQGEQKIGYFKYFAPWQWVVLATGYEKDVFSSRDQLRTTLFQIIPLVIFVGIILVSLTIRKMFRPIERLTESTMEVARGNWDVSIDYDSKDEIGTLAQSFNKMVQSLRENARIWHEFQVARDMQAQMLPEKPPEVTGLKIAARSIPTKEVGGDFYDFLALHDDRIGIVVGDVSGHGVSAAMVMTAAMGAVRFAAEGKRRTNEVLNMVNLRLNKDIQSHMFVALFYGIYEPSTRKLFYTNAGQTVPYVVRNGSIHFLPQAEESDRFPLGIVPSTIYEQLTFELHPGDKLVFYTDGIVDAMNGTSESYGFDRFAQSIQDSSDLQPPEMIDRLVLGMQKYSGDTNVHDDVTLVIVELL